MNRNRMNMLAGLSLLCLTIHSCKSNSPTENIIGDWDYVRMEKQGPQTDAEKNIDKRNQGLVATFRKNGNFISVRPGEGKIDTTGYGDYKISDDGKFLITIEVGARHPDTLKITELNSKMLKITSEDSEVIVFKRK